MFFYYVTHSDGSFNTYQTLLHSYKNQSTDLYWKSIGWFLYDCNIDLIRVKESFSKNKQSNGHFSNLSRLRAKADKSKRLKGYQLKHHMSQVIQEWTK